ncbi:MAG: YggS family pyridoxal phosphate enzyme [Oceanospirillales bacterium TMED91]|mgnify:FL=1|jgi:pyridoxal phosphate enzyme (YggS family)|nr:YggS family pyridoxal phosphate-dependent enzyme [Gammaproteobacteria bacterium]MDB3999382.1 YggS family pyridoxal phosphate-dependent enzyme [Litorivicinus sp.]OUX70669.1 MAG: YggS family pyridoxal phosphate enzyme [Oceanospirillales bacterium TMED91]
MDRATELKQHLTVIDTAIREAASACGRDPESIQLLAVSKTKPSSDIQMLHALGQRSFGENYVQEAVDKIHELQGLDIEWHYIGHIQSNKTKLIATEFDWVHTVDREKIASRLNDARDGDPLNILIQVNVDLAETKSGVSPTDLKALAMAIWKLPHLKLRGLMSIPDPVSENDLQRAHQQLKALFEEIKADHPTPEIFDTLSMGMTNDLELAISEGSTMVRIGTALFGARAPKETL